uniref:G-protein coupled receptors family 1 profile domain-containing protein n=1 Tax=Biomphalaria glabrata TaxID=6526 RepID=A0A2C9LWQ3_BIOGL
MSPLNANASAYTSYFPPGSLEILTLVDFVIIYTIISVLGIIANFIIIVVFVKMGPQDSVNISLLGLSISDFCFLLLNLFLSICYYPFWEDVDLNFNILDLKMLTVAWPQFYFRRVSNWITAFIMLDKCICISLPLKVKDIITPKRTIFIVLMIYFIMALTVSPPYFSASYVSRWDDKKNRTKVVLVFHENSAEIDSISSAISFVFTIVTFIWATVCSLILVISLQTRGKKLKEMAGYNQLDHVSIRDKKIIKMVTLMSILFIVSFTPDVIALLFMTFDYRVSFYGLYKDLFFVLHGVSEPLIALTASVNIFVYYTMSSKYREVYLRYFLRPKLSRKK